MDSSSERRFIVFGLDYDDMTEDEVKMDATRISDLRPDLGPFRIERSRGGNFHVTWPRSHLGTFDAGYELALESRCDKDWLAMASRYGRFGLFSARSLHATRQIRARRDDAVTSPSTRRGEVRGTRLVLTPANLTERERILEICASITDPNKPPEQRDETWTYRLQTILGDATPRVVVGCLDRYQARRRVRFLRDKCGVRFTEQIL